MGCGINLIDPGARRLSARRVNWFWVGRTAALTVSSAVAICGVFWLWQLV